MNTDQELVIPLSKTKMILALLGAIVFVALGGWLFTIAGEMPRRNPLFMKVAGIAAVAFFGLVAVFISKKLFDHSPGLIINAKGIFDNSSGVAAGLIPWDQITEFSVCTVQSQRFLIIHVCRPERYLDQGNSLRQLANKANYKLYGSPVQISANSLKTNFDELRRVIQQYFEKYGSA